MPSFDLNATLGVTLERFKSGPLAGGNPCPENPAIPGQPLRVTCPLGSLTTRVEQGTNTPRLTYSLTGVYRFPEGPAGEQISLRADWRYRSDTPGGSGGDRALRSLYNDRVATNNYGVMNVRGSVRMPKLNTELAVFVTNLFDRDYYEGGVDWSAAGFGYWSVNYAARRKWGVELTYYFGSEALQ